MTNYFDVDAYSASAIKAGATSMLQMNHFMTTPSYSSPAMARGSLQHLAILEPFKFAELKTCDADKRTKAYKGLVKEFGKGNIITTKEHGEMLAARKQVIAHPEASKLLVNGKPEVEKYWVEQGVECKCKIDWETPEYIVEYKTTGNLKAFERTAKTLAYQLQLAWYWHAAGRKPIYIVAQEQKAPFDVAVMNVAELDLMRWLDQCWEIISSYESCKSINKFPGAYPHMFTFEIYEDEQDVEVDADSVIEF